jgi:hypothetical protein
MVSANYICIKPLIYHPINKQWSLNLLFSCIFCIESKIVHDGAEKIGWRVNLRAIENCIKIAFRYEEKLITTQFLSAIN